MGISTKIHLEKLNEEMSMSSMDLASARTLILAFLTNSDDDATGKFKQLRHEILGWFTRVSIIKSISVNQFI